MTGLLFYLPSIMIFIIINSTKQMQIINKNGWLYIRMCDYLFWKVLIILFSLSLHWLTDLKIYLMFLILCFSWHRDLTHVYMLVICYDLSKSKRYCCLFISGCSRFKVFITTQNAISSKCCVLYVREILSICIIYSCK